MGIVCVVLDGPLVNFEGLPMQSIFAMLQEAENAGQMMYVTCHRMVVDMAEAAGVPVVSLTGVES